MVRARCRCAAAGVPPGSTNEVKGASWAFKASMSRSRRSTWLAEHPQPLRLALALGHREVGAEIEQIVLDQAEHRIDLARLRQMQPDHADRGVGLVDGSIGGDAQVVFRAAFAAAERRGAVVAGPGVDAIEDDHGSLLQRLIAQTASMVMTIATNCSNTRNRISFCDRFGDPPRIMLSETEQQDDRNGGDRDGKEDRTQEGCHRRYITPRRAVRHPFRPGPAPGATIWLFVQ